MTKAKPHKHRWLMWHECGRKGRVARHCRCGVVQLRDKPKESAK